MAVAVAMNLAARAYSTSYQAQAVTQEHANDVRGWQIDIVATAQHFSSKPTIHRIYRAWPWSIAASCTVDLMSNMSRIYPASSMERSAFAYFAESQGGLW